MTALCPGGGPSAIKPTIDPGIAFTATVIDAAIKTIFHREVGTFSSVIASGIALASTIFCGSDPPSDPGLTETDWNNVTAPPDPVSYATSYKRVIQWFLSWYWGQICECTGAQTPVITPGPLPTGIGRDTGLPQGTLTGSCWNVTTTWQWPAQVGPGTSVVFTNFNSVLLPSGPSIPLSGTQPGEPTVALAIPLNTSAFTVTLDVPSGFVAPATYELLVNFYNASGTAVGASEAIVESGKPPPQTFTLPNLPANATYWSAEGTASNQPISTVTNTFSFNCSDQPPLRLQTPCCPPDPTTQQTLQLILNIVGQVYTNPPGSPKTGWAAATAHSGLSGTGSFNIASGVTGVRATFTTIPTGIRVTPGTPTFYWDLGFVTPLAMTYPLRSLRTVFASQDMPLPIQTDGLAYTFPPGVVVTLTELVPA